MRRTVATLGALMVMSGILGVMPAQATHCGTDGADVAECEAPLNVVLFEGIGNVCNLAARPGDLAASATWHPRCVYHTDPFWAAGDADQRGLTLADYNMTNPANCNYATTPSCSLAHPELQGLYVPKLGPPANSPFDIAASGLSSLPNSACVASVGGTGCSATAWGTINNGENLDAGAYCGSSHGAGYLSFTAADDSLRTKASFGWEQSAGSLLPFKGEIVQINGQNVPAGSRPQLIGLATSRGFVTPDKQLGCGVSVPVKGFQTEGFVIAY